MPSSRITSTASEEGSPIPFFPLEFLPAPSILARTPPILGLRRGMWKQIMEIPLTMWTLFGTQIPRDRLIFQARNVSLNQVFNCVYIYPRQSWYWWPGCQTSGGFRRPGSSWPMPGCARGICAVTLQVAVPRVVAFLCDVVVAFLCDFVFDIIFASFFLGLLGAPLKK